MQATELTGPALDAAVEAALGDDLSANTDERLRDATGRWWVIHQSDSLGLAVDRSGFKHIGMFAWKHRDDSPWKESIEQHVAAYRAEPRPFHRDLTLAVGLLPAEWQCEQQPHRIDVWVSTPGPGPMVMGTAKFAEFPDAKDDDERRAWALATAISRAFLECRGA